MKELISPIIKPLIEYFNGELIKDKDTNRFYLFDSELNDRASSATTGQVACLYLLDEIHHGTDNKKVLKDLVMQVSEKQLSSGAFSQPFSVEYGQPETIDIAEVGAVANALYHLYNATKLEETKETLIKSAEYLLTQVAKENQGVVYKSTRALKHDVLNGDIYAAHTWGRAYELTENKKYLDQSLKVIEHVKNRFGVNEKGWWPYIEDWEGEVIMGNSISYQGTIVAFANTLLPILPKGLRDEWVDVASKAIKTMNKELAVGPNDRNEVPFWSRDWANTWEIYYAFWKYRNMNDNKKIVTDKLKAMKESLTNEGISVFEPNLERKENHSPITTTFRKAATFSGILSYMILDKE